MPKDPRMTDFFGGERVDEEVLREALDGDDGDEKSYRRGYQQGANDAFRAVEFRLTPRQATVMSKWIERLGNSRRSTEELPPPPKLKGGRINNAHRP